MMEDFSGRTAVVTGGGTGIGRAIALALAAEGANVVVAGTSEHPKAVADEIVAAGGRSLAHFVDVRDVGSVEALADAAYKEFGSVELLVNNAGVTLRPFRASWDASLEDYRWVMDVNYWGVVHGHSVFVPRMLETEGEKHIVNNSSVASLKSIAGHAPYTASKAAVDGFSRCAREELKTQGIGVSILHPGAVRTPIVTIESRRPADEQSENRNVKPWSDYDQASTSRIKASAGPLQGGADPDVAAVENEYISTNNVGNLVLAGIRANLLHILTHPAPVASLQAELESVLAGAPQPRID